MFNLKTKFKVIFNVLLFIFIIFLFLFFIHKTSLFVLADDHEDPEPYPKGGFVDYYMSYYYEWVWPVKHWQTGELRTPPYDWWWFKPYGYKGRMQTVNYDNIAIYMEKCKVREYNEFMRLYDEEYKDTHIKWKGWVIEAWDEQEDTSSKKATIKYAKSYMNRLILRYSHPERLIYNYKDFVFFGKFYGFLETLIKYGSPYYPRWDHLIWWTHMYKPLYYAAINTFSFYWQPPFVTGSREPGMGSFMVNSILSYCESLGIDLNNSPLNNNKLYINKLFPFVQTEPVITDYLRIHSYVLEFNDAKGSFNNFFSALNTECYSCLTHKEYMAQKPYVLTNVVNKSNNLTTLTKHRLLIQRFMCYPDPFNRLPIGLKEWRSTLKPLSGGEEMRRWLMQSKLVYAGVYITPNATFLEECVVDNTLKFENIFLSNNHVRAWIADDGSFVMEHVDQEGNVSYWGGKADSLIVLFGHEFARSLETGHTYEVFNASEVILFKYTPKNRSLLWYIVNRIIYSVDLFNFTQADCDTEFLASNRHFVYQNFIESLPKNKNKNNVPDLTIIYGDPRWKLDIEDCKIFHHSFEEMPKTIKPEKLFNAHWKRSYDNMYRFMPHPTTYYRLSFPALSPERMIPDPNLSLTKYVDGNNGKIIHVSNSMFFLVIIAFLNKFMNFIQKQKNNKYNNLMFCFLLDFYSSDNFFEDNLFIYVLIFFLLFFIFLFFYMSVTNKIFLKKNKFKKFLWKNIGPIPLITLFFIILPIIFLTGLVILEIESFISLYICMEIYSFLGIILTTLCNGFLIRLFSLNYLILSSFSSGCFLFGVFLFYSFFGTLNLTLISDMLIQLDYSDNMVILAYILIIYSLFFKLGAGPWFFWTIDVYERGNFISFFFFLILSKWIFFFLLAKIVLNIFVSLYTYIQPVFFIFGLFSLLIGSVTGLVQYKIKRLLAYSSLSTSGLLFLLLSAGCTNAVLSSYFFYLIIYLLSLSSLLSIQMWVHIKDNKKFPIYINELNFFFSNKSYVIPFWIISLFNIAGMPFFVGFLSKLVVLQNILNYYYFNDLFIIIIIISLITVLNYAYYFKLIKNLMFFYKKKPIIDKVINLRNIYKTILKWIHWFKTEFTFFHIYIFIHNFFSFFFFILFILLNLLFLLMPFF